VLGPSRDQAGAQPGPACRPAACRHPATHSLSDGALRQGHPNSFLHPFLGMRRLASHQACELHCAERHFRWDSFAESPSYFSVSPACSTVTSPHSALGRQRRDRNAVCLVRAAVIEGDDLPLGHAQSLHPGAVDSRLDEPGLRRGLRDPGNGQGFDVIAVVMRTEDPVRVGDREKPGMCLPVLHFPVGRCGGLGASRFSLGASVRQDPAREPRHGYASRPAKWLQEATRTCRSAHGEAADSAR
jgi:hypothetical protein